MYHIYPGGHVSGFSSGDAIGWDTFSPMTKTLYWYPHLYRKSDPNRPFSGRNCTPMPKLNRNVSTRPFWPRRKRERDKVRTNLDYETNNALLVWTIHPLAQTLFRISDAPNKKQRFPANYICIVKDLIKIKLFSGDPIICLRVCPLWERRAKKTWAWKHTYHHSDAN